MFQRKSDGFWVEVVKIGGKDKRISAKTKTALQKKLRDLDLRQEHGPLFSDIADQWFSEHAETLQPTSISSYQAHVKRAKHYFDGMYVNEITPSQCQGFIDRLVARCYARDTIHRSKTVLSQIFSFAITLPGSTLRFNPCDNIRQPRGLKHTRREPPSPEQLLKVDANTQMGLFAEFLLYTGLRRGELLALEWRDIDRERKVIHVRQRVQFAGNQPEVSVGAKTSAGVRTVPLLDELAAVLPKPQGKYVFGGSKPLTASAFHKRWIAWCREVGLAEAEVTEFTGKNGHRYKKTKWKPLVTPHQFRHQYATMLYRAGVSELDTKTTMGHASIVVTRDIYQHIQERDQTSEVATKLSAYLAEQKENKRTS